MVAELGMAGVEHLPEKEAFRLSCRGEPRRIVHMKRLRLPCRAWSYRAWSVVTVEGGPGSAEPAGIAACAGRTPHGFVAQEAEVATGITRFIRGGEY